MRRAEGSVDVPLAIFPFVVWLARLSCPVLRNHVESMVQSGLVDWFVGEGPAQMFGQGGRHSDLIRNNITRGQEHMLKTYNRNLAMESHKPARPCFLRTQPPVHALGWSTLNDSS
jgi:hypothetical protein